MLLVHAAGMMYVGIDFANVVEIAEFILSHENKSMTR